MLVLISCNLRYLHNYDRPEIKLKPQEENLNKPTENESLKQILPSSTLSLKRENPLQKPKALAFQKYDPKKFKCSTEETYHPLTQNQPGQTQIVIQSEVNEHTFSKTCPPTFV
jgi:hypothetical protein